LRGTTLSVYRYLFRKGVPLGPSDVQNGLRLSSPSIAYYHLQKLLEAGLIQEEAGKYVVNRVVFENMVRVRKTAVPLQTTYVVFFASAIILLLSVLRPASITPSYLFAILALLVALGASIRESIRALQKP
jgi:hypothetical protein